MTHHLALSGVIYYAYTSTCISQHTKFELRSFTSFIDMIVAHLIKWVT